MGVRLQEGQARIHAGDTYSQLRRSTGAAGMTPAGGHPSLNLTPPPPDINFQRGDLGLETYIASGPHPFYIKQSPVSTSRPSLSSHIGRARPPGKPQLPLLCRGDAGTDTLGEGWWCDGIAGGSKTPPGDSQWEAGVGVAFVR